MDNILIVSISLYEDILNRKNHSTFLPARCVFVIYYYMHESPINILYIEKKYVAAMPYKLIHQTQVLV